eukprot:scaffold350_cov333-Pavlova_lutheri.AAC.55
MSRQDPRCPCKIVVWVLSRVGCVQLVPMAASCPACPPSHPENEDGSRRGKALLTQSKEMAEWMMQNETVQRRRSECNAKHGVGSCQACRSSASRAGGPSTEPSPANRVNRGPRHVARTRRCSIRVHVAAATPRVVSSGTFDPRRG